MPYELFARYASDPLALDQEVRRALKLPEDRYFTVTTWPEDRAGQVFVDKNRTRVVRAVKVSKSDQK